MSWLTKLFRIHSKIDSIAQARLLRLVATDCLELQFRYALKGNEIIAIPTRFLSTLPDLQINGKFHPKLLKACRLKLEIDKMGNFNKEKKQLQAQLTPKTHKKK